MDSNRVRLKRLYDLNGLRQVRAALTTELGVGAKGYMPHERMMPCDVTVELGLEVRMVHINGQVLKPKRIGKMYEARWKNVS